MKILFGFAIVALLGLCALVIALLPRSSAPLQSILKVESVFPPGTRVGYMGRTEPFRVINLSSNAILIGAQYLVERKDTGEIVAATRKAKASVLPGKSGKNSTPQTVTYIQLTGTNHGAWRLLVPVGNYRLIADLEGLFGKAPGTWIKNWAWLNSYLSRSTRWVASDWFTEPSAEERANPAPYKMPVVMDTLRYFYGAVSRWPTNFAELKAFAGRENLPLGTNNYEDAVFTTDSEGGLSMSYRNGTGHLSMGKGGPALIRAHNDLLEMMSNSTARLVASELRSLARSDETSAFSFIASNFRAEYGYWPTNLASLLAFAKKDKQPAVPQGFLTAVFTLLPNGGVQITSTNGTLTLGGPAPPASTLYPGSGSPPSFRSSMSGPPMQANVVGHDNFILRSSVNMFHGMSRAWPTNLSQLAEFLDSHHMQPVPARYASAVFSNTPEGNLVIVTTNGMLSFGQDPRASN